MAGKLRISEWTPVPRRYLLNHAVDSTFPLFCFIIQFIAMISPLSLPEVYPERSVLVFQFLVTFSPSNQTCDSDIINQFSLNKAL